MQRTWQAAIRLPRSRSSAARMLGFVTPPEVSSKLHRASKIAHDPANGFATPRGSSLMGGVVVKQSGHTFGHTDPCTPAMAVHLRLEKRWVGIYGSYSKQWSRPASMVRIEEPMSQSQHNVHTGTQVTSVPGEYDLVEVAEAMRLLSERMADHVDRPLEHLVSVAVDTVDGARWASVTVLRANQFSTAASTGDQAVRADALQYELGTGPCVDAVLQDSTYVTGDVGSEPRWSTWGRRASTEVGVHSVLSQRLHLHEQVGVVAGLNIYSDA